MKKRRQKSPDTRRETLQNVESSGGRIILRFLQSCFFRISRTQEQYDDIVDQMTAAKKGGNNKKNTADVDEV